MLEDPPYGPGVDEAKVPNAPRSLSPDAQDTLMKYLYKGMAMPGWGDVSGSVLLGWHKKVRYAFPPLRRPLLEIFTDESWVDSSLLRSPELDASSGS